MGQLSTGNNQLSINNCQLSTSDTQWLSHGLNLCKRSRYEAWKEGACQENAVE